MFRRWCRRDEEIDAGLNLPRDKIPERLLVERSILMERSNESSTASAKLHENKITRIGGEEN